MASIRLTSTDPGNPPVILSSDHITKVVPRKAMRPDLASQHQHFHMIYDGTKLSLTTGETVNVTEDHDSVVELVWGSGVLRESQVAQLQSGIIPQSQVPNLTEALQSQGISTTTPAENPNVVVDTPPTDEVKPVKKAPAKKVAPPAGVKPEEAKAKEEDVD
jgi:hypothetical protein